MPLAQFGNFRMPSFNLPGISGVMLNIVIWVIIFAALIFCVWFFILRPRQYKYLVEIKDITGGGMVVYLDRGAWLIDSQTGVGEFRLMKTKPAQIFHPGLHNATLTKKAQYKFEFLRFGPGPFDYKVIPPIRIEEQTLPDGTKKFKGMEQSDLIPLADEDWAKYKVKSAYKKTSLGGWFAEHKNEIIMFAVIGFSLVVMISLFRAVSDSAGAIASEIGSVSREYVGELASHTEQLRRHTDFLTGQTVSPLPEEPPPGI